jgi:hypothetical protein
MNSENFWVGIPCSSEGFRHFGGIYHLYLQCQRVSQARTGFCLIYTALQPKTSHTSYPVISFFSQDKMHYCEGLSILLGSGNSGYKTCLQLNITLH